MIERIHNWLAAASAFLVVAIFALIVADVAARALFSSSLLFAVSLVEYAQLYFVALIAPVLARQGSHVTVDFIVRLAPPPGRVALYRLAATLSALISTTFAFTAIILVAESMESGAMDIRGLTVPTWVLFMPLALSFLLMALEFASRAWAGPPQEEG